MTVKKAKKSTARRSAPKRKVAIFDVDGTVFRSSLFIELIEEMIAKDIFPSKMRDAYGAAYKKWHARQGSYDEYLGAMVTSFMKNIKGVPYGLMADVAAEVVERDKDRVYCYPRDLLKELKKKGYYLLAISQSPKVILDHFCTRMGFDKTYGRVYEIGPDDRLTGNIAELHLIANKANILKRAVEKENLTLKGSIGVGDTEGDVQFLEKVETAICFNPSSALYRHAKRNGWKVVVERKDVIYEL